MALRRARCRCGPTRRSIPPRARLRGRTLQLNNVLDPSGTPTFAGTLGASVGEIFNRQFFYDGRRRSRTVGVPLSRIDSQRLRRQHLQPLGRSVRRHRGDEQGVLRRLRRPHRAGSHPGAQPALSVGRPRRAHDHADARQRCVRVPLRHRLAGGIRGHLRLPLPRLRRNSTRRHASHAVEPVRVPSRAGRTASSTSGTSARPTRCRTVPAAVDEEPGDEYLDGEGIVRTVDAGTPCRRTRISSLPAAGLLRRRRRDRLRGQRRRPADACRRRACSATCSSRRAASRSRRSCSRSCSVAVRRARRPGGLRDRRRQQRPADAPQPRRRQRVRRRADSRSSSAPPAAPWCCPKDGAWSVVQHDQGTGRGVAARSASRRAADPPRQARARRQDAPTPRQPT